jgi:16S rRNA processing protein RimM
MRLVVGRVGRPHGLRGEVTVEVRTDDPADRFRPGAVLLTDPPERGPLTISVARWHSGRLLLCFDGCLDREGAEALRNTMLEIESADLKPLADPEEFYDHDLIGLAVMTVGGEEVGIVADILHHGQNLLIIDGTGAKKGAEIMVPFVTALVPEVNLEARRLVIDPPPGLLNSDEAQ